MLYWSVLLVYIAGVDETGTLIYCFIDSCFVVHLHVYRKKIITGIYAN